MVLVPLFSRLSFRAQGQQQQGGAEERESTGIALLLSMQGKNRKRNRNLLVVPLFPNSSSSSCLNPFPI